MHEIENIVREAGNKILNSGKVMVTSKEGHANYVTNIDFEVEDFLKKELLSLLPGSVFIGEEQKNQILDERPTWVVDPIDGTLNFYRGWACSAVSVALLENKVPVLACIYQPYKNEMFTAQKSSGAFLNHERIHVSDVAFEQAVVGFGTSPYYPELARRSMMLAMDFLQHAGDLRRCGSAAYDLACLACGRQDVFFELCLSPWDVAAGALLVEEAGGSFQMPFCTEVQFEKPAAILAANQKCIQEAVRLWNKTDNKKSK